MHLILLYVSGPTQQKGHTLDLILSYGLPFFNVQVHDAVFSDHMPVLFNFTVPCQSRKQCVYVCKFHILKPFTPAQFSSAFNNSALSDMNSVCLSTEQLTLLFLSTCTGILDSIAPLKAVSPKPQSEPWLKTTRAARRECRRAEHRWTSFMCLLKF